MNSYSSSNSGLPPLPGPSPLIGQTVKTTTTSTSTIKPSIEMPSSMKDSGNTFNFIVLPLVATIFALLGFIAGSLVTSSLTGSKNTTPTTNDTTTNNNVSYPLSSPIIYPSFETKAYMYNGNTVWTVKQPVGWQVNEGGLLEGFLTMSGKYNSNTYSLTFSYPIFDSQGGIPASLQAWVDSVISLLGSQGSTVQSKSIKVDGVDAIELLGVPTTDSTQDAVYIWSHGSKNPSLIIINFVSGTFNATEMQYILETVVSGTKLATT